MFGLRQKLFVAFGGLLVIILAVSTLGIAVLRQHRTWLDTFLSENWRSVEYGQGMLGCSLQPLNAVAQSISGVTGQPTAAEIRSRRRGTRRVKPLESFDENVDAEDHNITFAP